MVKAVIYIQTQDKNNMFQKEYEILTIPRIGEGMTVSVKSKNIMYKMRVIDVWHSLVEHDKNHVHIILQLPESLSEVEVIDNLRSEGWKRYDSLSPSNYI